MMNKQYWAWVGVALLAGSGCKKAENAAEAAAEAAAAPTERSLVTGPTTGPAGYKWERAQTGAAGSVELPSGEGWKKAPGDHAEVSNESLDITVMIQVQAGVPAEARSDYLKSLTEVNKRDAPKYQVVKQDEGQVAQKTAGRLDGKFDNGKPYATRDYVLFVKEKAVAIMVRGALEREADVNSIADRVAASYQ